MATRIPALRSPPIAFAHRGARAHARENTGIAPNVFECAESKTFYLCGCKASNNAPFCDGTHATLE